MPLTADAIAAQQVQERLKSIYTLVQDVEKRRAQGEASTAAVVKLQEERSGNQNIKLKSAYRTALQHAEQEEALLRAALQKITEIRNIKNERRIQARQSESTNKETIRKGPWMKMLQISAQTLPLFVGKVGEKPPALCGAIPAEPSYHAKVGDMVATLVEVAGDGDNWILAEVVSFNSTTNKYEVDDILEEQNQMKRHVLPKSKVVPLPLMRANPETDSGALFLPGTLVLALWPQTTCFYKAIVHELPTNHTEPYTLLFEDTTYPEGYSAPMPVAQRYVIAPPQLRNS